MRIAIIGSPRAGKTTLARELQRTTGYPIIYADELIVLGWSAASDEIARRMTDQDMARYMAIVPDIIFEGVAVVRGLRKALGMLDGRPVDRCIVLERPRVWLSRGQRAMQRGCASVLAQIEPELVRRGVLMERP